jgi:auxin efflux carrier family protein
MDYIGPEVENDEVRETLRLKQKAIVHGSWLQPVSRAVHALGRPQQVIPEVEREKSADIESRSVEDEKCGIGESTSNESPGQCAVSSRHSQRQTTSQGKHVSFCLDDMASTAAATETAVSPIDSPEIEHSQMNFSSTTATQADIGLQLPSSKGDIVLKAHPSKRQILTAKYRHHRVVTTIVAFLRTLATPASLSILISFVISLVPTLKALFVPGVPGTHIPSAPDGLPPLSFLIDAASFIGAASVPLGLICLGSALANLKVPRSQWAQLPLGAIGGLAVGKMLVMPVLGVLICEGLTNVGVIDKEDKVLRFVCM